jgi:beta-mannosidase
MLDKRAFHYFVEDIDLKLQAPKLSVAVETIVGSVAVTITAGNFVKDVCLMADRLDPDAVVDSMLVTLLPGESHVFTVTTEKAIVASDITLGTVLRSANDLIAKT